MSRSGLLVFMLVLAVGQLAWLFVTWRKDGFGAAFKLFLYGIVSSVGVALQYEMGL